MPKARRRNRRRAGPNGGDIEEAGGGDSEEDLSQGSDGLISGAEDGPARGEEQEAGQAHVDDPAGAMGAHAGDEIDEELAQEWQAAQQEPLPFWDPDTCRVHDGQSADAEIMGRMKLLHVNTRQESLSVYCRRHQCSRIVRVAVAPHTDNVLRWLQQGADIPAGPAHKREHLALWPA